VTLLQISIAQVLGHNGTAIEHAKALRPTAIPTSERQGPYWVDAARAWHQWGKPDACYRALRSAERAAPAEVRYRPPVRRMTEYLLSSNRSRTLPGLQEFAARIGSPPDLSEIGALVFYGTRSPTSAATGSCAAITPARRDSRSGEDLFDALRRELDASSGSKVGQLGSRERAMLSTCGSAPGGHVKGVPTRLIL
jgi:hypothetical protein